MYIDDGISIESEPLDGMPREDENEGRVANQYTQVDIEQVGKRITIVFFFKKKKPHTDTRQISYIDEDAAHTRLLMISSPWDKYDDYESIVGSEYTIVFWHRCGDYSSQMTFSLFYGEDKAYCEVENRERLRASIIKVRTDKAHQEAARVKVTYGR